jgi:hypothetical protein
MRLWKQRLLDAANVFDGWRIIPRIVMLGSLVFVGWYVVFISRWYMMPESHSPATATQDSAFAIGVITALSGIFSLIFKWYASGGRDWADQPYATSTTVSTSTVKDSPSQSLPGNQSKE